MNRTRLMAAGLIKVCSITSPLYVANHHKDLCCISIYQVSSQTCVALKKKLEQKKFKKSEKIIILQHYSLTQQKLYRLYIHNFTYMYGKIHLINPGLSIWRIFVRVPDNYLMQGVNKQLQQVNSFCSHQIIINFFLSY